MLNMTSDRPTDLVRLRLAAALTHQLRAVALTVWPAPGPSVVVARDRCHHPDLSACTLRDLVRAALQGETTPVGLRWMFEVADLTVLPPEEAPEAPRAQAPQARPTPQAQARPPASPAARPGPDPFAGNPDEVDMPGKAPQPKISAGDAAKIAQWEGRMRTDLDNGVMDTPEKARFKAGNVRQLENLCHWLTVMAPGQNVDVADLPTELRESTDGARLDLPADWNAVLAAEATLGGYPR